MSGLTPRQLACLRLIADGHTYTEIGRKLDVAERTVKFHLTDARTALRARNTIHAVAIGYQRGHLACGPVEDLALLRKAREMGYRIALVPLEDA